MSKSNNAVFFLSLNFFKKERKGKENIWKEKKRREKKRKEERKKQETNEEKRDKRKKEQRRKGKEKEGKTERKKKKRKKKITIPLCLPGVQALCALRVSFIKPSLVLHVLHFIGDFFDKTRASLARAAFKRDFLFNQKGNLLDKGVA